MFLSSSFHCTNSNLPLLFLFSFDAIACLCCEKSSTICLFSIDLIFAQNTAILRITAAHLIFFLSKYFSALYYAFALNGSKIEKSFIFLFWIQCAIYVGDIFGMQKASDTQSTGDCSLSHALFSDIRFFPFYPQKQYSSLGGLDYSHE